MSATIETIHASLSESIRLASSDEVTELIQVELSNYPFAAALAGKILELGDPNLLWIARFEEGELAGELGLLAGVEREKIDPPTYVQFRLNTQDGRSSLYIVGDTINAILILGAHVYQHPFPILEFESTVG